MTRAVIVANRDAAKAAWLKALEAQSYTINMGGTSRSKTNQDVNKLQDIYLGWESRLDEYDGNTRKVKFGTVRL